MVGLGPRSPQRGARGAEGTPPARLLHLHQHSLVNLLVVGGEADERLGVARSFHLHSPLHGGPFVAVDCQRDAESVARGLSAWAAGSAAEIEWNPFTAARGGTLLLDSVERLPISMQRQLLAFVRHQADAEDAWLTRLAAGLSREPSQAIAEGGLLPALYDTLDKIRIEVSCLTRGAA